MGARQTGHSFLVWIHWKRHLQWNTCPQVLSRLQFSSSVMQITQVWSGAVSVGLNILLKCLMSWVKDLYLLMAWQRATADTSPALSTERIHRQSNTPSFCSAALMNSRSRLQQCHTRTELPAIFQNSSRRQVGLIWLMLGLKQLSMSEWVALLESHRNSESTASIMVGNSSSPLTLRGTPTNTCCTSTKQQRLPASSSTPQTLLACNRTMMRWLQEQSLRRASFSMRTAWMAPRSMPTPTQERVHTARSKAFHCTSERISTTMERWQKQEYSSDLLLCCGRTSAMVKWATSTRWMRKRRRRRAAAMVRVLERVTAGRTVVRVSSLSEGMSHISQSNYNQTQLAYSQIPSYPQISHINMQLSIILLLALALQGTLAAYCHGKPKDYYTNEEPIWNKQPTLIRKHKYGELHEIGEGPNKMKLIHVEGNMYQMGYAHGALLKDELHAMIGELWAYIEGQVEDAIPKKLPRFMRKGAANFALGTVLDLNYEITLRFTNSKYYDEMRGISDASGVDFKYFRRIHMIGELTKGACSMLGAWGNATSEGQTVQIRALDWDLEGPFRKYPLAIVYHPSSPKFGNAWLNIGFVGWIGVLSGVNEHQLAVSQIGVSYPDPSFGKESRFGNPFTFVLRDVLQWDKTLSESIHRMQTTKRTCNLILGVGDGKGEMRSFQYSHSVCNVIGDTNPLPKADWHPELENVVYHGMDWLCPPYYERLHELLEKYHGSITAELAVRTILPGTNTGNLQIAVYDLTHKKVYFSYGDKVNGHYVDAYHRPYIMLELEPLFAYKLQQ